MVAALIVDESGRVLLVRKRGTTAFMQPGGKPEAGETDAAALARELDEELSLRLDPDTFDYLGRFETQAANEHGHDLVAEVFSVAISAPVVVAAEIEEFAWVDLTDPGQLTVAPLTRDFMQPFISKLSEAIRRP